MKIKKEALLYDIANLAYVIADTGEDDRHELHRVRDICEDGNLDRVNRILGIAYSCVLTVLSPLIRQVRISGNHDFIVTPHDYEIRFRKDIRLTTQLKLKIRLTVQEYMCCRVLEDWLGITWPEMAEIWKKRSEKNMMMLERIVMGCTSCFPRRVSPI